MDKMKYCCVCEEEKPATIEYFHRRSGSDDGLRCDCKTCRKNKNLKLPDRTNRRCSTCKELKPNTTDNFHTFSTKSGSATRALCKVCHSKYQKEYKLMKHYGLSLMGYELMIEQQDAKCAICNELTSKLVVDHCHTTGKVRSLLCNDCNTGIGMLKENKEIMLSAIEYIDHHGTA